MDDIDPQQKNVLLQLFKILDTEQKSYLSADQVMLAVQSQGFTPELPEDVEQYDFSTFCAQFKITQRPKDKEDILKKLLVNLDNTFEGKVNMVHVRSLLKDNDYCDKIFKQLDVQNEETLQIEEFTRRLFRL
ncbi:hypothetical protein SS50377_25732 [Spironucleus salmonicida]|uniref:EF-hand domain-containing protein n=1 Tax=Spironucleus salmonicida TaxID=348837 RepID=V6LDT9_9EUKA|nr:hypothetical protein SS50377_25732 [Spironucleus salmonicida]|eukprot:EST42660.1 Hypothetical protein SS50377_17671 [Spironucleus salmonicida]